MKILTGELRGKDIQFKPNPYLRPTADKVRKAIFDMLQGAVEGKSVLDLYSGTGAMGLEALSSGAEKAVFVEKDKRQCERIKENLIQLGLVDRGFVVNLDAVEAIAGFGQKNEYYDLIFLDPPYEKELGVKTLRALSGSKIVHEESLIILEMRKTEEVDGKVGGLKTVKTKVYGDTKVIIYKRSVGI